MKNSVPPAVFIGAIVVMVAVACFFGIRALFPPNAGGSLSPSDYKSKMQQVNSQQQNNMEKAKDHVSSNAPPGYQDYIRRTRGGGGH